MLGPRIPYTATYRLVEAFRHISTHEVEEVLSTQLMELRFLGAEDNKLAFCMQQLESSQQAFPATKRPWAAVTPIFDKLLLVTDLTGALRRVLNKAELADKWAALRRSLPLQHPPAVVANLAADVDRLLREPGALEKLLRNASAGFLLADTSGLREPPGPLVREQQLDYFLDGYGLPLFTTSSLTEIPAEAAYTLATVGVLNAEKFNQKAFAKWLKRKVDIYDLKVEIRADFEQRHVLNRHQQVTYAEQYVAAEVPGCYSQTRARTLELLK
ncbi:MAG: hypothetical protein EOO56_05455 [Hymenobacter sp.]|nr:MAG: hypothetical protein EOO56_05455 [Hymenobacter sp.]